MLVADRVVCDFCHCLVGQLFNQHPTYSDSISDISSAPDFVVCPDCYELSVSQGDLCLIS